MPRRTQSQFKKLQQLLNETRKREMELQKELELCRRLEHQRTVRIMKSEIAEIRNNEKTQRWKNRKKINKQIQSYQKKNLKTIVCKHTEKNCYLMQKMYEKENEIIKHKDKAKQFGEDILNDVNELQLHFHSLFATAFKKSFNGQKKAIRSEINYLGKEIYKLQCKLTGKSSNRYKRDFLPKDNELWKFAGDGYQHLYDERRVRETSLQRNTDEFNYENIM